MLLAVFICIFYTTLSAIANTEKTPGDISTALEEGCMRTCLNDYTKIAKCDINEMISEYILELSKKEN